MRRRSLLCCLDTDFPAVWCAIVHIINQCAEKNDRVDEYLKIQTTERRQELQLSDCLVKVF